MSVGPPIIVNVVVVGIALDAPVVDWSLVMHTGGFLQAGEKVMIFLPFVRVTWPNILLLVNPCPCKPKTYWGFTGNVLLT